MKTLLEVNKTVIRGYTVRAVYYSEVYGLILGENLNNGNWVVAYISDSSLSVGNWFVSNIFTDSGSLDRARTLYMELIQEDLSFLA